jgi:hypothetical protein
MGRPSLKTPELVAELFDRLTLSDGGLEGVCAASDMPSALTVLRWVRDDEEFRKEYVRARESAGEIQAWRAAKAAIGASDPAAARVEYDARKWLSGKLNGKWYGDRTTIAGDADAPLVTNLNMGALTPDQLRALATIPIVETER